MVETDVKEWDLAAPVILVEEAGGRFTDLAGERRFDTRTMLVSNGILHDEMLARLHDPAASPRGRLRPVALGSGPTPARAPQAPAASSDSARIRSARSTSSGVVTSGGMIRIDLDVRPGRQDDQAPLQRLGHDALRQLRVRDAAVTLVRLHELQRDHRPRPRASPIVRCRP